MKKIALPTGQRRDTTRSIITDATNRVAIPICDDFQWDECIKDGTWAAMNADGTWRMYANRPAIQPVAGVWESGGAGQPFNNVFAQYKAWPCSDWRMSLRQKGAAHEVEVGIPEDAEIMTMRDDTFWLHVSYATWKWPEWIKAGVWLTMDRDGTWLLHHREPGTCEKYGCWGSLSPGQSLSLMNFTPPPCSDWTQSKRQKPA
jgi:hypothetical protein